MILLTFGLPDPLIGNNLAAEIATALGLDPSLVSVGVNEDRLEVVVPEGSDLDVVSDGVAAHTGQPTPEQQVERDAGAEAIVISDQLQAAVVKARSVWRGESSYTNAQRDKILAGLVIFVARRVR